MKKFRQFDKRLIFPAVLTLIFISLVVLKINGSSVGLLHEIFYPNKKDPALLANQPRPVRWDEWNVGTLKTIAQNNHGFSVFNSNVGNGEDQSVLYDLPVKDWSILFRPHNWGFLVLPLENAFAFKWWFLIYALTLTSYALCLKLLKNRVLTSVLISIFTALSPFFHWWYLSATISSFYYSLAFILLFILICEAVMFRRRVLLFIATTYVISSFVFIFYPPFMISCLLVVISFCAGFFWHYRSTIIEHWSIRKIVMYLAAIGLTALTIVSAFLYQHKDTVSSIVNSSYPGHRLVQSGGFPLYHIFSGYTQYKLQSDHTAAAIQNSGSNQSEFSNFLLLFPFILILLAYLRYKKRIQFNAMIGSLIAITGILFFWFLIPNLSPTLGNVTLLNRIPHNRLLVGIGLLNFLWLIVFMQIVYENNKLFKIIEKTVVGLVVFIFISLINLKLALIYPGYTDFKFSVISAAIISVAFYLLMEKRMITVGLTVLCFFSFASIYSVNPIYSGLEVASNNPIVQSIKSTPNDKKKWIVENITFNNLVNVADRPSISSTYLYPQNNIWKNIDGGRSYATYNRYAHVNFTMDRSPVFNKPVIEIKSVDQVIIDIEPCDSFFRSQNVGYILATSEISTEENSCISLLPTHNDSSYKYYIYKLNY